MGIPSFGRILQRETDDSLANPSSISDGADGKESPCDAGDPGSIPGSGRSPGEGNDIPLQYFCLPWTEEPHGLQSSRTERKTATVLEETAERLTYTRPITHRHRHTDTHTPYQPRALGLLRHQVLTPHTSFSEEK